MQSTHKIAGDSATGYATYLTALHNRGDYYTAGVESGSPDRAPGDGTHSRWLGSPQLLDRLGLSSSSAVERDGLVSLLGGRSPADGSELRPVGAGGSRVAGIDLTFSAPKSVSALWAVSDPQEREQIEQAHSQAVAKTVDRIEREVGLVRTRRGGQIRHERASSVLAAELVHTTSRLTAEQQRGGVPDPQLHSHLIVFGAERRDGRFAAVDSRELFRSARVNGAYFRAELASGLERLGLSIEGQTGRDGRYFELQGVPKGLIEQWSARSADIERAAMRFRSRYGRDPRAGELGALTVQTRGGKSTAEQVDVNEAWRAVGAEHGLDAQKVRALHAGIDSSLQRSARGAQPEDLAPLLLGELCKERSVVEDRELKARAYELSAGICTTGQADRVVQGLLITGELVRLEDGRFTTRELRERELRTVEAAAARAKEEVVPVSAQSLREARRQAAAQIGSPLSAEQREALDLITGEGGVSILVGQAGTGKGVVLSAANSAWRSEGAKVYGIAVAGATAERLGADANIEKTMSADALLTRARSGRVALSEKSVIVMDEAGMADTRRLSDLVELSDERGSKLLLVGDEAQLPSIGAGGFFAELQEHVPSASLSEVHRARNQWERDAWMQLREGDSHDALARYQAQGRLHISETREDAAEQMLAAWDRVRRENPGERVLMLSDASNVEIERINARAQELRAKANELGAERVACPGRAFELAAGDRVIFTAAMNVPAEARVENGTLGEVVCVDAEQRNLALRTQGANEREVAVEGERLGDLRLAYAQHVYKAQGATVDRAFVLIGGWQTDRERSYVALSRARERTDIYVCREDLGEQGMDAGAIERLGQAMAESHAQVASLAVEEVGLEGSRALEPQVAHERESDQGMGRGLPDSGQHAQRDVVIADAPQLDFAAGDGLDIS